MRDWFGEFGTTSRIVGATRATGATDGHKRQDPALDDRNGVVARDSSPLGNMGNNRMAHLATQPAVALVARSKHAWATPSQPQGGQSHQRDFGPVAPVAHVAHENGSAPNDADFDERAAVIEGGAGVPRQWAEGFARLDLANRPTGFTPERWRQIIDDGGRFLDRWGSEAARLGWMPEDVFGVHPTAPDARYDNMGLVPLIGGKEVIAIAADRATIRHSTGSFLSFYRSPVEGAIAVWELVSQEADVELGTRQH